MMYANFYVNGLQFLVCMLMIYSLGKFTHLPAEKLQFDKKTLDLKEAMARMEFVFCFLFTLSLSLCFFV